MIRRTTRGGPVAACAVRRITRVVHPVTRGGAAADPAAETAGAGNAVAGLFGAIATAEVPITTLVIGEGGSGGALAFCSADRVWLTPGACFSVIAPELAAGILRRDPEEIPALADALKPSPEDLLALGVIDGIAGPEPVTFLR
ncbi:hypothetical protein [Amycolatopsis sp. cmx-4-54]|uniref:hypothetical protein n=1 Tax=Amycolatopsis sp. cmx-4-54 TaxID=2790936 RepID=UPI0039788E55